MILEMPVCEHSVPIKYLCAKCKNGDQNEINEKLEREIKWLKKRINVLENQFEALDEGLDLLAQDMDKRDEEIDRLDGALHQLVELENDAERVIKLVSDKAHDLKKIDSRRDDVINSLCQKIMDIDRQLREMKHADTR